MGRGIKKPSNCAQIRAPRRNRRAGLIAEEIRSAVEALRFHFRGTAGARRGFLRTHRIGRSKTARAVLSTAPIRRSKRQAQRQEFMRCGVPRGSARDWLVNRYFNAFFRIRGTDFSAASIESVPSGDIFTYVFLAYLRLAIGD